MQFFSRLVKHAAPIRKWGLEHDAQLTLSLETFELLIQAGDFRINLIPRFVIETNGGPKYVRRFPEEGNFIGWMPYPTKSWPLSSDKRLFKEYSLNRGLRVPASWRDGADLSPDFIVKPAIGSFGKGFKGPFGVNNPMSADTQIGPDEFCEQFIRGRSTKAWFWNGVPYALEMLDPPCVLADGRRPLQQIIHERRGNFDAPFDLAGCEAMLQWQGYTPNSIPAAGNEIMLDFRYVTPFDPVTLKNRDVWPKVAPAIAAQFAYAGPVLYNGIDDKVRENSVFTVDAVVDDQDRVWFLEMNSHPMIHPKVYVPMLDSMISAKSSHSAVAIV